MIRIIVGLFFILHGLVYLLYTGHSQRMFELKPGLLWPDSSWVFSKFQGEKTTRLLAGISCILAAIGFVTGGVIFFTGLEWWYPLIAISAIFSIVVFILFWDGEFKDLDDKGWIGMLINLLILVALQFLNLNEL